MVVESWTRRLKDAAFLAVVVPNWYLTSALSVVCLKQILTVDDHAVAGVVDATFAQLLCGALGGWLYTATHDAQPETTDDQRQALLLASSFGLLGTASTNWAIVVGGASFSQIVKLAEPAVTVVVSYLLIGERTSVARLVCIGLTSVGVYLSSRRAAPDFPELDGAPARAVHTMTWVLGLASMMVCFALRNVYSKRMAVKSAAAYAAICARGLELMTPFVLGRFAALPVLTPHVQTNMVRFALMAASSAAYNVLSFAVLARVTPVTHAQLRLGKRIASLAVSVITLSDIDMTLPQFIALNFAFAGLVGYVFAPKAASPPLPSSTPDKSPRTFASLPLVSACLAWTGVFLLVVGTDFARAHRLVASIAPPTAD